MRSSWFIVLVVSSVVGCGSVSSKPDAGSPGDGAGSSSGALALGKPSSWVPQTQSRTVDFTVTRDASTTGDLVVHVASLPTGVTAADVTVAAGASSGTLTFAADASATLGSSTNVDVQLLAGSKMLDTKPFTVKVSGLPGTVDTTFGNNGKAQVPLPDPSGSGTGNGYLRAMLAYPAAAGADADKILVAAQLETTGTASTTMKEAVIRLKADGTPDITFGGGAGYVLIDGSPANGFLPVGLALDSQNRIIIVAYHITSSNSCTIHVARLTPAGMPDSQFTTFDAVPDSGGYCGSTSSVAVLAGDKILVAATWNNSDGSQRPLLLQLKADGTRDTTAFNGSLTIRLPNPDTDKPSWLLTRGLIVADGGYYFIGAKCEGGWSTTITACESVLGRVTAAGAWDTNWGSAGAGSKGYSQLTFGTSNAIHEEFENMRLDASGHVVTVGYNEGATLGVMARFDASTGAVDSGFGSSGRVTPTLVNGATQQELDAVALDSAGNIVIAGYADNGGPLIVTTRYTSAGVLDTTWGTNGVTTTAAAALNPQGAIQSDDRFLAGGSTPRGGTGNDVAVWRYWF